MKPNYPLVIPGLPPAAQKALQEIRTILHGGGTLKDNQFAAVVELPFVHGEPVQRKSPLRGGSIPIGFEVIAAWDDDQNAIDFPTPKFDENVIENGRPSGEYSITFRMPAPDGVCSIYLDAATNLASSATPSAVPFDTEYIGDGGLSFDAANTAIACSKAGIVNVSYSIGLAAGAAGRVSAAVRVNGAADPQRGRESQAGTASVSGMSGSGLAKVSAGDLLTLYALQDSGGPLAFTVANKITALEAYYVHPPIGQSGTVLGILWGG